jgi:hypothetical protein
MKRLLFFGVLLTAFAVAGVTYALPVGVADTGTAVGLQLNQSWTGTVAGTLNGGGVDWYTGYGFNFTYGGTTYNEPNGFCVDPADATLSRTNYYIESLTSTETKYDEAAWLVNQAMKGNITMVTAQAAIWEIMFNGNGYTYTMTSDSKGDNASKVSNWVTLAENNYQNLNLTGFYIATNPGTSLSGSFGKGFQDYLFFDPDPTPAPVPEPTTLILIGSGLLGLAGFRKKLNK